jgi:hypothetical protein
MLRTCLVIAVLALAVLPARGIAQIEPQCPATGLQVEDTPSDGGQSVNLDWKAEGEAILSVLRSTSPDQGFELVGEVVAFQETYMDGRVEEGTEYYYRLLSIDGGDSVYSAVAGPVVPRSNWFRHYRVNALVLVVLMFVMVVSFIQLARRGKELYIRRIAGLSAIDEAVGRATEMGKKILYVPGIMSLSEIQTIASLSIMSHVAKQTATYGADIEVPNKDPLTFSAARETVKQAYMEAGKPDQFREEMVSYITYDQFAYAASVSGKMVREKPATNFLIGSFFAESLILAEMGQASGAIQIAGTADVVQLPFFVTTCDYTLLGEELYAASAYLSREPVLLGSIKAQDITKAIIMVYMALGIVTYAFGVTLLRDLILAR